MTTRQALGTVFALAITMMISAAPDGAQGPYGRGPQSGRAGMFARAAAQKWLAKLDTDHDGSVSLDEFHAGMMATFNRVDTNGDGYITKEEAGQDREAVGTLIRLKVTSVVSEKFKALDKDHDGTLSSDEWPANPEGFAKLDADHDGTVSYQEIQFALSRIGAAIQQRVEQSGLRETLWNRVDTNADGRISVEEFQAAADNLFDKLDRNGDGVIDKNDFAAGGTGAEQPSTPPRTPEKPPLQPLFP